MGLGFRVFGVWGLGFCNGSRTLLQNFEKGLYKGSIAVRRDKASASSRALLEQFYKASLKASWEGLKDEDAGFGLLGLFRALKGSMPASRTRAP